MKHLIFAAVALSISFGAGAVETKRICHKVLVKGKTVEQCKNVKIHKKLQGTAVPEKKKK